MKAHIDTSHWLERSATQDGQWDHSPWPAQMARLDSDTEQEEEEEEVVYPQRLHRPAKRQAAAAPSQTRIKSAPTTRPSSIRSTSHRQLPTTCPLRRRRHQSMSTPETAHLHIDTILPLQLPPPNLCKSWWSGSAESLRRSDSTTSFVSASSDGSWHGDSGDEDPNGQLEKALSQMSTASSSSMKKKTTKDGLLLTTYDYEDEDDYYVQTPAQADIDDTEAEAIRLHAGALMNNVASFFLDVRSLASSYYYNDAQCSKPSIFASACIDPLSFGSCSVWQRLLASRTYTGKQSYPPTTSSSCTAQSLDTMARRSSLSKPSTVPMAVVHARYR